jgi:hypothetical protein
MGKEDRMPALLDTVKRVTQFATLLCPDGISVRVLNYDEDTDGRWDNLKTVGEVTRKTNTIPLRGETHLGTVVHKKILKPMILSKAKLRSLKKPVIVHIITDGEVSASLVC